MTSNRYHQLIGTFENIYNIRIQPTPPPHISIVHCSHHNKNEKRGRASIRTNMMRCGQRIYRIEQRALTPNILTILWILAQKKERRENQFPLNTFGQKCTTISIAEERKSLTITAIYIKTRVHFILFISPQFGTWISYARYFRAKLYVCHDHDCCCLLLLLLFLYGASFCFRLIFRWRSLHVPILISLEIYIIEYNL